MSIGVVIAALTGCGHSGTPGATPTTTTSHSSWERPDAPPDPRTLVRAGAAAVGQVPDSTLIFIESETDDTGTWKVLVVTPDGTEQEMKIGVDGITVMVGPTPTNDSDADKAEHRALVHAAHLDYQAAVGKMLAAVPNGSITKLSLVDTDNVTTWRADVWDTYLVDHIVTINAASGDLISNNQV